VGEADDEKRSTSGNRFTRILTRGLHACERGGPEKTNDSGETSVSVERGRKKKGNGKEGR
jgi:hypothetical protein